MKKRIVILFIIVFAFIFVASCGSNSSKGPSLKKIAKIEISPKSITESFGAIDLNGFSTKNFLIINTGNENLDISDISLDYQPANTDIETSPDKWAFQLEFNEGQKPPVSLSPQESTGTNKAYYFNLKIFNLGDDIERTANIIIKSNAEGMQTVSIPVKVTSGRPKIKISPEFVDFQKVGFGDNKTIEVTVRNQGSSDLVLSSFAFTGNAPFHYQYEDINIVPDDNSAEGLDFDPKITIAPEQAVIFKYSYSPESEHPANGSFIIFSNDPDASENGTLIQIQANNNLPCIEINPAKIDFGPTLPAQQKKLPVEIKNCGLIDLELYDLKIIDDSKGIFSIIPDQLFSDGEDNIISKDKPYIIPGGETRNFEVKYAPSELSPLDEDGKIIPDTANLHIENNSFYDKLDVSMTGLATKIICPQAVITVEEGEQVIPQTILHLHGDQSYSANGAIKSYQWTVQQPTGSQSVFIPDSSFPNPIFEANVAGEYVFQLEVIDEQGIKSCEPTLYKVTVIPDEAIHIELLWDTPNDPDQTDEGPDAGTDMDLHFAHPFAAGPDLDGDGTPDPWFNIPYDVFWFNKSPEWGSLDPSIDDNPSLDRDDTDGAGPENINLNIPEGTTDSPFVYRVGVHYWDDKGFGPSLATVRVYIYAVKVFEVAGVKMNNHDLWDACTIEWPSTKVELKLDNSGNYKVTPNYPEPIF